MRTQSSKPNAQSVYNKLPYVNLYTDGASRGNPGPAALGLVILDPDGKVLIEHGEYLGVTTNNQAEYTAIIRALQYAKKFTKDDVHVFMDSELAQRQLTGRYKVKNKDIAARVAEVIRASKAFKSVVYSHIPREKNKQADRMANEALDRLSG